MYRDRNGIYEIIGKYYVLKILKVLPFNFDISCHENEVSQICQIRPNLVLLLVLLLIVNRIVIRF